MQPAVVLVCLTFKAKCSVMYIPPPLLAQVAFMLVLEEYLIATQQYSVKSFLCTDVGV